MKRCADRLGRGFTLIELLVVIAIIGLLAAMIFPVLARAKVHAKIVKAKLEMGQIVSAIQGYESAYSLFPVSTGAIEAVAASQDDFTFGTAGLNPFKTPSGPGGYNLITPGNYQTNNSEVMAILLDLETFPNGVATVNLGHAKNSQKHRFLDANMTSDLASPGIAPDGVYRDPWGSPYIITMDLNSDEKARDAFYSSTAVSEDPNSKSDPRSGLNGLGRRTLSNGTTVFEATVPIMVWSAGPDRMVDPNEKANQGANKDNILSWKQ